MRAMCFTQYGNADVLHPIDMPVPAPGPRDLLIEVAATAINPVDYKIRGSGRGMQRTFPVVLGYDVCGRVAATGDGVERFRVGDVIYASPSIGRNGANAAYVLVDERTAAIKPESLSAEQAAALPLVTLTAWESLHVRAAMHPGEAVFIQGGGGGVGHVAIQLAHHHGCRVITTAGRPESMELCEKCGADVVLNYHECDVVDELKKLTDGAGVPVALDCVGGEGLEQCMDAIAFNGRVVGIVHTKTDTIFDKLFKKSATLHTEFMGVGPITGIGIERHGQILQTAAELADAGKLTPHIAKVIGLDDIPAAHREIEQRHVVGKIVVAMKKN
ncbi:MAG: quinone oxidoreductase family protein [Phycisphaerales bacterium]